MDVIKEAKGWMEVHGSVSPIALSTQIIGGLIAEVERLSTGYVDSRTECTHLSAQVGILQSSLARAKEENERMKGECICGHDGKLTSADCPRHGTIELSLADHAKRAKNLIAEVEKLQSQIDHPAAVILELRGEVERAKTEGRREALEEAAKIADDQNFDHSDCDGCRTARTIAAAIRQQAVQETDGPTGNQVTIVYLEADLEVAKEKLKQIETIVDNAPELNMSNYDVDQVSALNNAMIEIYNVLQPDEGGEQI